MTHGRAHSSRSIDTGIKTRVSTRSCSPAMRAAAFLGARQVSVGEVEEALPVVARHVVLAGAYVVADAAHRRLLDGWHRLGRQPVGAEQPVDRVGVQGREELAARV